MKYILVRPQIKWKKVFFKIFMALSACAAGTLLICRVLFYLGVGDFVYELIKPVDYLYTIRFSTLYGRIAALMLLLELFIFRKNIAIFMVRLYQKFAPESIRSNCLYEPCCSNYMIMAIEKYGFFRGICRGVKRIGRCKIPNGGIDYP